MPNPKIAIVRATPSELGLARQAIAVHLATSHFTGAVDDAALADFLAHRSHYLLMAMEGKKIAGSLYGYALRQPYRREPQFFLYAIDVRPECRKRGIGTALVNQFVREAKRANACEVWVLTNESNRAAMAMYARAALKRPSTDDAVLVLEFRASSKPRKSRRISAASGV